MSKNKNQYYVVWQGKQPGIYDSWESCEPMVKGCAAKYKGFATRQEAEKAYAESPELYIIRKPKEAAPAFTSSSHPVLPALAVDAACSGNPGLMEFRGVIADTGTEVFHRGPYKGGTNNIGEFLAIVLGLAYLQKNHLPWALYSDSRTALSWFKKKQTGTKLEMTEENKELFIMLEKAELWLRTNTWTTQVYKWDTDHWGEIPADFGRK